MNIISYWHRHCTPYLRARFGMTERGASLVEYALLVALIAVVCIGAVSFVGTAAEDKFLEVEQELETER